jgi:hypothetical protein
VALDPFYTTKEGKKSGLGLSLWRFRVEQAGGTLTLGTSELGGFAVKASMQLHHIDRSPLGDLAATFSSLICTNPDIDLRCRLRVDDQEWFVSVSEVVQQLPPEKRNDLTIAGKVYQHIHEGLTVLEIVE